MLVLAVLLLAPLSATFATFGTGDASAAVLEAPVMCVEPPLVPSVGCERWTDVHEPHGNESSRATELVVDESSGRAYTLLRAWDYPVENWTCWRISCFDQSIEVVAHDTTTGALLWELSWNGGAGRDVGLDLVVSPDGSRVYVAGILRALAHTSDWLVLAIDAQTGDLDWVKVREAPGGPSAASNIAVSSDSEMVFVAGNEPDDGRRHATLTALRVSDATEIWHIGPEELVGHGGRVENLILDAPRGRLYASSLHENPADTNDDGVVVSAVELATGTPLWTKEKRFYRLELPIPGVLSPDGNALFLGLNHWGGKPSLLMRLDLSDARWGWEVPLGESGFELNSLAVDPLGRSVFATGGTPSPVTGRTAATTLAINATTGNPTWSALQERARGYEVLTDSEGDCAFVAASISGYPPGSDAGLLVYDAQNGALRKAHAYAAVNYSSSAHHLALDEVNDTVLLAGRASMSPFVLKALNLAYDNPC